MKPIKKKAMKNTKIILSACIFAILAASSSAQTIRQYTHPKLNYSFSAEGNWQQNPYHKDSLIYEMVNHEEKVHVLLWYNGGTEMSCERYLKKMAGMKGLECKECNKNELGSQTIWLMECTGKQFGEEAGIILAAQSYPKAYGMDAPARFQGKSYKAMHIAQIWCPLNSFEDQSIYLQGILHSLRLKEDLD